MPTTDVFEQHAADYDRWFDVHAFAYRAELAALRALMPAGGSGLEVGVGTGRFAAPLGIRFGIEPSGAMRTLAQSRGIATAGAVAEALPFPDEQFDHVLFVTTVCFLDELDRPFAEAYRVLRAGGAILVGLIDRDSPLGQAYEQRKASSRFYRDARFHTTGDVRHCLAQSGFSAFSFTQTLFHSLEEIGAGEAVKSGYGEGAFVVIRAIK